MLTKAGAQKLIDVYVPGTELFWKQPLVKEYKGVPIESAYSSSFYIVLGRATKFLEDLPPKFKHLKDDRFIEIIERQYKFPDYDMDKHLTLHEISHLLAPKVEEHDKDWENIFLRLCKEQKFYPTKQQKAIFLDKTFGGERITQVW